jgi:hypothetical protein
VVLRLLRRWLLEREIRARIAAFARACADPEIVESTRVGGVE